MGACAPLPVIVEAVAIGISEVGRAIRREAVALQPSVGDNRRRRLEFIGAYVHRAPSDARVTVEIGTGRRRAIEAGIDARRVGLETQVARCLIDKERSIGEVAYTICGQ